MTGKELERIVSFYKVEKKINLEEISALFGMERNNLYILFKRQEIPKKHELKALELEKELPIVQKNDTNTPGPSNDVMFQVLGLVTQQSKMLETQLDQINKNNDQLIEANKILTELLGRAVEDGRIGRIEKSEAKVDLKNIKNLFKGEAEYKKAMGYLNESPENISICIADSDGKIILINDEFTRQTGYKLEEMKGRKPGNVLQRDNTSQDGIKKIREAIKGQKYFEGEILNYAKDGTEIVCKISLVPIKDKRGKLERFVSLAVFSKVNALKYN